MSDGTGTSTYTYDSLGRLTDSTDGAGSHLHYGYDLDGNVTAITYPNGNTISRTFNDANRLASVTDWNTNQTTFSYNPDGALTGIDYPNGVTETNTVNRNDLTTEVTDTTGATTLADYSYTRDGNGLLTATTPTGVTGQTNESYGHTALNQLSTYTSAGSSGAYGYDTADNPTSLADGTTQTFDAANQLQESALAGVSTSYTYNLRGDRTSAQTNGNTMTYSYDQADRLTSYASSTTSATYSYDGTGLRTDKTVDGSGTHFAWDVASESIPELLTAGSDSYIYGPEGQPLERITQDGTTTYVQHDQQGSTRLLTDASGAVVGTYTYDPYGRTVNHTGQTSIALQYDGQYRDDETGFYYLRARYYDPTTAQFLSRDPLEALTQAPYAYVEGDPLDGVDPTGLCSLFSWGGDGCIAQAAAAVPGGDSLDSALTSFVRFGDEVTFGASRWVRHEVGLGGAIDECSSAYNNTAVTLAAAVFMFADGEGEIEAAESVTKLATQFGRTEKEIREAIHAVKGAAKFPGNPNVVVDSAGEAYPLGKDGKIGESIGNIFDFLADE